MTDTEQTEPVRPMSAKWRLLEVGEKIRIGDEFLDQRILSDPEWIVLEDGDSEIGCDPESDMVIRRRMTPAEEHAEELLAGYKAFLEWVIDPEGDPNAWGLMVHAAECDIAKAEGRPAPQP